MRKALSLFVLMCVLSVPAFAGSIPIPPSPPCQENCGSSPASSPTPVQVIVLLIVSFI